MQKVFIQHIDTPALQQIAQIYAQSNNYDIYATVFSYDKINLQKINKTLKQQITLLSEDDIYSDVFIELLLSCDIFILSDFDVKQTIKVIDLIQQSCRSVYAQLISQWLIFSQKEQNIQINIESQFSTLPQFKVQKMLVDKFQNIISRKSLNNRQISGSIIYHGIIYDSYATKFNSFKELCEFVQYFRLFPYFTSLDMYVPFSSCLRVAMYSFTQPKKSKLVLDQNLTLKEVLDSVQKGLFGTIDIKQAEKPLTVNSPERKDKKQQQVDIQEPEIINRICEVFPIKISLADYAINKSLVQILEQQDSKNNNGINLNNFNIQDIISQFTVNNFTYSVQLRDFIIDDFTVKSFEAFLTYEESQDPIVQQVQDILLQQAVSEIPHIALDIKPLLSLFSFKIIDFKDIFLLGNESLNQLETKIFSFKQLQQYICLSPAYAIEWIFMLGENCKNIEYWEGFLPEVQIERQESAKKGKAEIIVKNSDYLAFICRIILSKKIQNDSKDGYNDYLKHLNNEEDSWLLALAISLQLVFIGRGNSFIYAHFDINFVTLKSLEILQNNSFQKIIQHFISPEYQQFTDIKKIPTCEKGFIPLSSYNPLLGDRPESRATPSCLMQRSQVKHFTSNSEYVQIKINQKLIINPIILEILRNGDKTLLVSRQDTYIYYKSLADQFQQHLVINDQLVQNTNVFELDINNSFSIYNEAVVPRIPSIIDVSSIFVPIQVLQGSYLLKYNQNMIQQEQTKSIVVDGKGSKPKEPKNIVSQTELNRDVAIKEIQSFNKQLVYQLLQKFGPDQLLVGQQQFTQKIAFIDNIFDVFGLQGFQQELLDLGIFTQHQLSIKSDNKVKNMQFQQNQQVINGFDTYQAINSCFVSQQYEIIFNLSDQLSNKFKEANQYFDKITLQEETKQQQNQLKQAGLLSEIQIENNSFGDIQIPIQESVIEPQQQDATKNSVRSSPKSQKSVKISPKSSPKVKPATPAQLKKNQEAEEKLNNEKQKEEQEQLILQQKELEKQKLAELEEQQKIDKQMSWYRQLSISSEYFDKISLQEALSKALCNLMLASTSKLVEGDDQIKFLGEELLNMSQQIKQDYNETMQHQELENCESMVNAGNMNVTEMLDLIE